ncbi:hypothetical protein LOD99_10659 [Oopsacas minuta]|uniref:Uncharacterized protein n=1 Tax=Oopsacas minuta TaxID=111878 RepID=A0AAV7KGE7_9METZ|nr:hypothetical protein LOD99_10659 [Oopsacas minuta]
MSKLEISRKHKFENKSNKRIDIKLLLEITENDLVDFPIAYLRKLLKSKCEQNQMLDTTALFENLSETRKLAKRERRCQVETELTKFDNFCVQYSMQITEQTKASLQQERDQLTREIVFYKNEITKLISSHNSA